MVETVEGLGRLDIMVVPSQHEVGMLCVVSNYIVTQIPEYKLLVL